MIGALTGFSPISLPSFATTVTGEDLNVSGAEMLQIFNRSARKDRRILQIVHHPGHRDWCPA
jgi:hypothetical protein